MGKFRFKILNKLDWYIIKKFLGTYFFSIALIIAISVVFDYNEHIDKLKEALDLIDEKFDDAAVVAVHDKFII